MNRNIQGQINKPELNNDSQRANLHFPHAYLNIPKIGINNPTTAEINPNLNPNITSIPASNENTVQNTDILKQSLNLLSSPSLNPNNDMRINPSRHVQNVLNEKHKYYLNKNIPQPQILHQSQEENNQDFQILKKSDEKINPNFSKSIENQTIPFPIVMPSNINNRQQFNLGRSMLPNADRIANDNNKNSSFLINSFSKRQQNQNFNNNNKYFTYQTIFELPESPSVPLFVPIDD